MKLENIELTFDNFSREMEKLYKEKHFDYLVTIVGEDFGEEGLGCIYILENTQSHARLFHKGHRQADRRGLRDPLGAEAVARCRPAGARGL